MIKLVATLYESGRGIIIKDGRYFNFIPPYTLDEENSCLQEGNEDGLEYVTTGHGYVLLEKPIEFGTLEAVVDHLFEHYQDWRKKKHVPDSNHDPRELLHELPLDVFRSYVRSIERRFIDPAYREQCLVLGKELISHNQEHNDTPEMAKLEELLVRLDKEALSTAKEPAG